MELIDDKRHISPSDADVLLRLITLEAVEWSVLLTEEQHIIIRPFGTF